MWRAFIGPVAVLVFTGCGAWILQSAPEITGGWWLDLLILAGQILAYFGLLWTLLVSLSPRGGLQGPEKLLACASCLSAFVAFTYAFPAQSPTTGLLMVAYQGAAEIGRPLPDAGDVMRTTAPLSLLLAALAGALALHRNWRKGDAENS